MRKIQADDIYPAIGPYSHAIVANGFLFVSGQIPIDVNGVIVGSDITEQSERVFENLHSILVASGASFENVVSTTCYLSEMTDFAEFNRIYAVRFTSRPARACIAAKALPKGALVEISVTAILPSKE